jgi:hypothetical protein
MKYAVLAALAATAVAVMLPTASNVAPTPGALSMSLNTTSINNLMQTFVPILSYYMLNNKTIETDIHESSILYTFDLDQVHIDTVTGFTTKKFEPVAGTDKIQVTLGGIDLSMDVDGKLKALHLIPLESTHVDVKGLNIQFTLESTSTDQVHFALVDSSDIKFDEVVITMSSPALQKLVNLSSGVINKIIKKMIPKVQAAIDTEINALNAMVAGEGPMTFVFPLATIKKDEIDLNMTMTTAPVMKPDSDLIDLTFDGMFVDKDVHTTNADIVEFPKRIEHAQSEQIYIHEDMVDSLFQDVGDKVFPISVDQDDISAQMLQVFREIQMMYGADAHIALEVSMDTGMGKPINFDTKNGVMVGSQSDITSTIKLLVTNSTVKADLAAAFELNLEAHANVTVADFVVYPNVKQIYAANTKVVTDNVGLMAHNYNVLFTSVLENFANDFNMKYQKGYPLANIDPTFGMLSGLLKDMVITPYMEENYLFAGFSMNADLPTMETVEIIQ